MASGSSGRTGSGSKGFDFNSDDVLRSYDDFANQEGSSGKHVDPVSGKDFRESRMGKPTLVPVYNQQDESLGQEVISTVEKTMKKYADNLLRFLEGISARLSQLELYCYNLEKSVGDMRTDLNRENNEADSKLRSLENHLQEVHRSIQILRDKQELADTQKELTNLQLVHKDSQHKEEGVSASSSDLKKVDNPSEMQNQQLALALPHRVNPSTTLHVRSMEQYQCIPPSSQTQPQSVHVQNQPHTYYPQQNQLQLPPTQTHNHRQDQFMQADPQYQRPQMQVSQSPPQPLQSNVIQPQQVQSFPSYQQQQWSQQYPQQVVQQPPQAQLQPQPQLQPQTQAQAQAQPQPQTQQSQINPQTSPIYPSYPPSQPVTETFSGSAAMQMPFPGIPQAGAGMPEAVGYGYGGTARMTAQQQPPPQHNMQQQSQSPSHANTYGSSPSDAAYPGASQPIQAPRQGYAAYDGDGGRVPHTLSPHFPHGRYPPNRASASPPPIRQSNSSQMLRGHPYGEMAEKAISMGYPRDYVLSVLRRMEESGQPVDFNSLLDRLNTHSSGGSQRPW